MRGNMVTGFKAQLHVPLDLAHDVVFILQVYFPQFVKSDLYFKYLGELINTVQTQDLPGIRRKRTGHSPYFRSGQ